jgi:hypothetical protein
MESVVYFNEGPKKNIVKELLQRPNQFSLCDLRATYFERTDINLELASRGMFIFLILREFDITPFKSKIDHRDINEYARTIVLLLNGNIECENRHEELSAGYTWLTGQNPTGKNQFEITEAIISKLFNKTKTIGKGILKHNY